MVKQVLTAASFEEDISFKETRFVKPPKTTYAVFMDSVTRRGADDRNLISEHDYTIELYSYVPDPDAEKRIETALDELGLAFDKDERYWLQNEQLYQVVYMFSYIEK